MKILLINSICGSGSTGRIVADLWKALKEEGHEAKVAYGFGKAKNPEGTIRILNDLVNEN